MRNKQNKVIAVHLYNDYSGSPRILAQWLQHAQKQGQHIELHSSDTEGILDEVFGIERKGFRYRPGTHKLGTLWSFLRTNWRLFNRIRKAPAGSLVYVNTLLPFGAILGAKVAGLPLVCHVHEVSVRPRLLKSFLLRIARRQAKSLICVSKFVKESLGLEEEKAVVVPNALSPHFQKKIKAGS